MVVEGFYHAHDLGHGHTVGLVGGKKRDKSGAGGGKFAVTPCEAYGVLVKAAMCVHGCLERGVEDPLDHGEIMGAPFPGPPAPHALEGCQSADFEEVAAQRRKAFVRAHPCKNLQVEPQLFAHPYWVGPLIFPRPPTETRTTAPQKCGGALWAARP